MYIINVSWFGGPVWDHNAKSSFNPNKNKSATEHLIETGGQSVDEAIENFDKYRNYKIKVSQFKPENAKVNWITQLVVEEEDDGVAETVKDLLVETYTKKKQQLINDNSEYRIEVEILDQ